MKHHQKQIMESQSIYLLFLHFLYEHICQGNHSVGGGHDFRQGNWLILWVLSQNFPAFTQTRFELTQPPPSLQPNLFPQVILTKLEGSS